MGAINEIWLSRVRNIFLFLGQAELTDKPVSPLPLEMHITQQATCIARLSKVFVCHLEKKKL